MIGNPERLTTLPLTTARELSITLTASLTCLCPVNGRQDRAGVTVTYTPSQTIVELTSFRDYLDSFADGFGLHEQIAAELHDTLTDALTPASLEIATVWAPVEGVDVTIRTVGTVAV